METFKLQKLIATSGFCSRRHAEKLIKYGHVKINNRIAKIGDCATLNCKIEIDKQIIKTTPPKKIYLILNKPVGFISTMIDDHNRKTAADLVKHKTSSRVFIVGRLDLNSQGLMLFTNDGDLAQKIMHPKHNITKTYEVKINKPLTQKDLKTLQTGVILDGKKTAPAKIKVLKLDAKQSTILIELHEGKKRQIRRMVETLNANVTFLKRTKIGPIALGNLKLGSCRHLSCSEVNALKNSLKNKLEPFCP